MARLMNPESVHVRLPLPLYRKVVKESKGERRSMNQMMIMLIEEAIAVREMRVNNAPQIVGAYHGIVRGPGPETKGLK